jgi:hypothetical protein
MVTRGIFSKASPFIVVRKSTNRSSDLAISNIVKRECDAMEDDCWSILALENVNSLAASTALKEG